MISEVTEVVWLDGRHELSLTELAALSGLSVVELQHLIECQALVPVTGVEPAAGSNIAEASFSAECLALVRTASRLRHDFDLEVNGLALTLRLLNRIHELEAELHHLRAQWPD